MAVVLITGCSSSFGLHASVAFARAGDTVYASMRDTNRAGALRASLPAGTDVRVVQLDVTVPPTHAPLVERIVRESGRLDVLVNNAGMIRPGAFEDVDDASFRAVMETNFLGPFSLTRAVLPQMRARTAARSSRSARCRGSPACRRMSPTPPASSPSRVRPKPCATKLTAGTSVSRSSRPDCMRRGSSRPASSRARRCRAVTPRTLRIERSSNTSGGSCRRVCRRRWTPRGSASCWSALRAPTAASSAGRRTTSHAGSSPPCSPRTTPRGTASCGRLRHRLVESGGAPTGG